jgi:hypothetical protein
MTMSRGTSAFTLALAVPEKRSGRLPISNSRARATSPPALTFEDVRQRPTRLLGNRREASEEAGNPKAYAAFVGAGSLRKNGHAQRARRDGPHPSMAPACPAVSG